MPDLSYTCPYDYGSLDIIAIGCGEQDCLTCPTWPLTASTSVKSSMLWVGSYMW